MPDMQWSHSCYSLESKAQKSGFLTHFTADFLFTFNLFNLDHKGKYIHIFTSDAIQNSIKRKLKDQNLPLNDSKMTFVFFFFFHLKTSSSSIEQSKEKSTPFGWVNHWLENICHIKILKQELILTSLRKTKKTQLLILLFSTLYLTLFLCL